MRRKLAFRRIEQGIKEGYKHYEELEGNYLKELDIEEEALACDWVFKGLKEALWKFKRKQGCKARFDNLVKKINEAWSYYKDQEAEYCTTLGMNDFDPEYMICDIVFEGILELTNKHLKVGK